MLLSVFHLTQYDYPEAAWDSFNEIWCQPVEDFRQSLLAYQLTVEPPNHINTRRDYFGNVSHTFQVAKPHQTLLVKSESKVLTNPGPILYPMPFGWVEVKGKKEEEFLMPTPRVPLNVDWVSLLGLVHPSMEDDLSEFLLELTRYFHRRFDYQPGATHVNTPLRDFLQTEKGVCQDFAHAMLAVLRRLGLPARYVSGYLHTGLGCHGSHAWVEVCLPHLGWVGFDPTNGVQVDEQYIKLAHGRDYDDCPPLKGQRCGGGREVLTVEVQVMEVKEGEDLTPIPEERVKKVRIV